MKWKIEGTDGTGDDVIVMVDADDAESATRQATFAGVKVKTVHPDEDHHPAVRLPPANLVTTPASSATPPPGYTGKVIIEREEDEESSRSSLSQRTHLPNTDADTIFHIAAHIVALALLLIGIVVFLRGWIDYGRVSIPPASAPVASYVEPVASTDASVDAAADAAPTPATHAAAPVDPISTLTTQVTTELTNLSSQHATSTSQLLAWQQSLAYVGQMLIGLLIVIIAILIEGFMTRMVVNIREVWHKKR